jgi:hypothetical protein
MTLRNARSSRKYVRGNSTEEGESSALGAADTVLAISVRREVEAEVTVAVDMVVMAWWGRGKRAHVAGEIVGVGGVAQGGRECDVACWRQRFCTSPTNASPILHSLVGVNLTFRNLRLLYLRFLYRPVYFYRYPAVRVYRSGINGIPLLTTRIQNPNQNLLYKR